MLKDCNYPVKLAHLTHCFPSETASCHMTQTGKLNTAALKLPLGGAKQLTGSEQTLKHAWEPQVFRMTVWSCSPQPMWVRRVNSSTFTTTQGQTDYQDVYSEQELTNWQVSSLTFSTSPCLSVIPTCFKQTTIDTVPKKIKVTCLNDYRPIALWKAGHGSHQHHHPRNPRPTPICIPP
jgi:hypothetical protein